MKPPVVSRSPCQPFTGLVVATLLSASFVFAAAPSAAAGAHNARVSADLADHLSAGSQAIRVIVHGTRAEVDALATRYNLRVARHLESGAVFVVTAGQLAAMRQDETQDHFSGDIRLHSSVSAADAESIGADQVWGGSDAVQALNGMAVSVAVIDSGINTTHNALKGRVLVTRDFTGGDGLDHYGHGTHVAAIIAGQAGKTAETGDYRGIAPGAYLLNLRVLGDDGSGDVSDVVEAIDWTIAHRREYNVRVINLSLGAPVLQPYRDDPLCEAVERAVRAGLVVVVAAGNYGQTEDGKPVFGGITSPANSPHAIAVGAIDTHDTAQRSDDTLAVFSSRGPTQYDLILKPDLAAPGRHIRSAESAGSYLSKTYPERHVSGAGANAVMQLSGTSMAAGFVSGAAALVLDARGELTPRDTKAALQSTSTFMPSAGLVGAGAGMINALAAVELVETNELPTSNTVGAGQATASGVLSNQSSSERVATMFRRASNLHLKKVLREDSIVWRIAIRADAIVWGTAIGADAIVWGTAIGANAIVWGTAIGANAIVWGTAIGANAIVWGTAIGADAIVWGTAFVKSDAVLGG